MILLTSRRSILAVSSFSAALLLFIITNNSFWQSLISVIIIYSISAYGLSLMFRFAGMLDGGHAAYFAIAAYTSILMERQFPMLPSILAAIVAIILTSLTAFCVGLALVKLPGLFFTLASMGVTLAVTAILESTSFTGGYTGVGAVTRGFLSPSLQLGSVGVAVIVVFVGAAVLLGIEFFSRSSHGHLARASRWPGSVAETVGANGEQIRLRLMVAGATITGTAGVLYALLIQYATPDLASISSGLLLMAMVVIGGTQASVGPLLGSLLMIGLPSGIQGLQSWQTLVAGLALLGVIVSLPGGLASIGVLLLGHLPWSRAGKRKYRTGLYPRLLRGSRAVASRLVTDTVVRSSTSNMDTSEIIKTYTGEPGAVDRSAFEHHVAGIEGRLFERRAEVEPEVSEGAWEATTPLLKVDSVSLSYGGLEVLQSVSISVSSGMVVGLIGPNGAGKTSLLSVIEGFTHIPSGSVTLGDTDITNYRPYERARIGMRWTFQTARLVGELTIQENIRLCDAGRQNRKQSRSGDPGKSEIGKYIWMPDVGSDLTSMLEALGIHDFAGDNAQMVPIGVQRLTEVARSMAVGPRLILLDEPAAGLGDNERQNLKVAVRDLKLAGAGVLLVDHDMDLIGDLVDWVFVLDRGRVIANGPLKSVTEDAAVIEAYLGRRKESPMGVPDFQ